MFTVKSERKTKVVQIPDKMNDQTVEENKVVAEGFHLCQQRNREETRRYPQGIQKLVSTYLLGGLNLQAGW